MVIIIIVKIVCVVLSIALVIFSLNKARQTTLNSFVARDLMSEKYKSRNINLVRAFFDITEKNNNTLDDQTWDDLIMDEVFRKLDRAYSSAGETVLYTILRNPMTNTEDLKSRSEVIELFKDDRDLLTKIKCYFYNLGFDNKNRFFEMITGEFIVNKTKAVIYPILGLVPIVGLTLAIILGKPYILLSLSIYMYIPFIIHNNEAKNVKAPGLVYFRNIINVARNISRIENKALESNINKIKDVLDQLKKIEKSTRLLRFINSNAGFFELLAVPFLIEEMTYYKISGQLMKKQQSILKLYYLIGELEALTSIAIYQECNQDICNKPKFTDKTYIKVIEGIHPLLEKPVENSIEIDNKGIVLTGTNMSGKSTFLRMISINIIFSQSFGFVLAKEYESCFFNLISSISPKDDILSGKSYYLAEAESILRIIKAVDYDLPIFCPIDEIFRGTNPVERISSSAEILRYINKKGKAICIVATHDKELSEILKEDYEFYYFSELVDKVSGLSFDYKIKKGISKTRNAIKLLDYIGYPKEIIYNSNKRIEELTEYT